MTGCSSTTSPPAPYQDPNEFDRDDRADDPNQHGQGQDDDDFDDDDEQEPVIPEPTGQPKDEEVEPNEDARHATYLGKPDCSADAALSGNDDQDWFVVRIDAPGPYVILTTTDDPDDDEATDTRLEVFARGDLTDEVAEDDDLGEGSAARIETQLAAGLYYIHVDGYSTATVGDYTIHVLFPDSEIGDPDDDDDEFELGPAQQTETESNGTIGSADSLGDAPSMIEATLDARDVDHFAFQILTPGWVTLETGPIEGDDDGLDTFVELLDLDGRRLGEDDDGADLPLFSRLMVELPEAGIYVVRVSGFGDDTHGTYSLWVQ